MNNRASIKFVPSVENEIRIRAGTARLCVDWALLWNYRYLFVLLVRRDFISKYSQSVLGPLWFVIQPLLSTLIFSAVFAGIANVPTDGEPAVLFYLSGMVPWSYFANSFGSCALTVTASAGLFSKVYFPRLIVPLAALGSNLFAVVIHILLLSVIAVGFLINDKSGGESFRWSIFLMPAILLQVAALALGAGLLVSALTAKYRDLAHATGFFLNIWFYATPVVFPLSIVPREWRKFAMLNPMSFPVEAFRNVVLGQGVIEPWIASISIGSTIVVCWAGIVTFQHCERTFVDTV